MVIESSFASFFVLGLVTIVRISAAPETPALQSGLTIKSHNLIVGARVPGDYLLSVQVVSKSSSWLRIVSMDVYFCTLSNETISLVRAIDMKTNGNGAYASITNGGPGNRNVTVHFKSQRGHGIAFLLEIYGRY